ncbi:MAG: helix-turn-helix domain-containing protein [Planctomycetota bacterium]
MASSLDEDRILYTRRDAADFLGVSERQLDTWLKRGAIQPTRLGRLVRVHRTELERVAAEGIDPAGATV